MSLTLLSVVFCQWHGRPYQEQHSWWPSLPDHSDTQISLTCYNDSVAGLVQAWCSYTLVIPMGFHIAFDLHAELAPSYPYLDSFTSLLKRFLYQSSNSFEIRIVYYESGIIIKS